MRLNIVDVSNVVNVGAQAKRSRSWNVNNVPTGGLYEIMRLLKNKDFNFTDDFWVFTFDARGNFRKEIYPQYKGNRKKNPGKELAYLQIDIIYDWLTRMGFNTFKHDGYEADDLIYSITQKYAKNVNEVYIISGDYNDLSYNLDRSCKVKLRTTTSPVTYYSYRNIHNKLGVEKEFLMLRKILCGETGDNIPNYWTPARFYDLRTNLLNMNINTLNLEDRDKLDVLIRDLSRDDEDYQNLYTNLLLAFPKYINLEIKPQTIDYEVMKEFLSIFRIKLYQKDLNFEIRDLRPEDWEYHATLNSRLSTEALHILVGDGSNSFIVKPTKPNLNSIQNSEVSHSDLLLKALNKK